VERGPLPENNVSPVLEISDLRTYFFTEDGVVKAVDGVDFYVKRGEVLGLVGESGCGKSATALSIMRLIGVPGRIMGGEVKLHDKNLLTLPEAEMRKRRGDRISMIFQQPQSSLNPVYTIGDQLAEVYQIHTEQEKNQRWRQAVDLLRLVDIPDSEEKSYAYPHEMSGGQAQRVMIAMALALNPDLLIADEPTTALDVTIQAQILDLMLDLRDRLGMAIILITHDLGVVAETADRIAVMYAGQIVEQAGVIELFEHALHPYTQGLINSIPVLGEEKERLDVIPGSVPDLIDLPPGCRFAPRCRERIRYQLEICEHTNPDLESVGSEHEVRCWLYNDADAHKAPLHPNLDEVDNDGDQPDG
jgi:oligopeptide/dipeptide ABC transporter ATP-binding protein